MADINAIGKQFSDFYYNTFDTNRGGLDPLYVRLTILNLKDRDTDNPRSIKRDTSMLTFEGTPILGKAAIIEKLVGLPFQKVQHKVTTIDAQPSSNDGKFILSITGLLLVDDSPNPLQFTQIFQLVPDGASYYVYNDIFRLNYG
ncbi:hypothetical protein H1R20_g436, partial [Candolleomyces eurysporus]